jgi:nicotinate-nucleotide adenylyltransferase
MKIALFGGSFNPPHVCHLMICYYVLETTDVDKVWLIPCYQHAFDKELVAFHHRFNMCSLAVEIFNKRVEVSNVEEEQKGISWTIDTVRYLKELYPDVEFEWIVGSDVTREFTSWKDFDLLQKMITFRIIPRNGYLGDIKEGGPGIFFPNISSTLIRNRIKKGLSISHLVPKSVEKYIREHRLYL